MRQFYFIICLLSISLTQAQNDSIYFWKSGALLEKRSIKTADLDSITFRRSAPAIASITICTQTWMLKNLDVASYSDGTPIPQVTDPTAWANLTTGAWCYYNNDPANGAIYGKLYNWYAVAGIYDAASQNDPTLRKKLAPTGWHVCSDAESITLTECLGGDSLAGNKMKATILWFPAVDVINTNSSGFTGLPGGNRYHDSSFNNIGLGGYWWSSDEYSSDSAWAWILLNSQTNVLRGPLSHKTDGFSVRCIKN